MAHQYPARYRGKVPALLDEALGRGGAPGRVSAPDRAP